MVGVSVIGVRCREFIILINSRDVFNNLLIYSKFKGGAHAVYYPGYKVLRSNDIATVTGIELI
jgi:hypothetical protein